MGMQLIALGEGVGVGFLLRRGQKAARTPIRKGNWWHFSFRGHGLPGDPLPCEQRMPG